MGNFLIQTFIVIFLVAVGWVGHWAFTSLDTKNAQVPFEEARQQFDQVDPRDVVVEEEPTVPVEGVEPQEEESEHADLIADIQELIDSTVYMKVGSRGARVGTVQTFLNLYLNESATVDNDYGPGTKGKVERFQREQGLTADGEAGPNTYRKMIEWLQEQS